MMFWIVYVVVALVCSYGTLHFCIRKNTGRPIDTFPIVLLLLICWIPMINVGLLIFQCLYFAVDYIRKTQWAKNK